MEVSESECDTTPLSGGVAEGGGGVNSENMEAEPPDTGQLPPKPVGRERFAKGKGWVRPWLGVVRALTMLTLLAVGHDPKEWVEYKNAVREVKGEVSLVTEYAPRWGAIFIDDHDVNWLVNMASIGVNFNFNPPSESESVPNYVAEEFEHKVSAKFFEEWYFGRVVELEKPWDPGGSTVAVGVVFMIPDRDGSLPHARHQNDVVVSPPTWGMPSF